MKTLFKIALLSAALVPALALAWSTPDPRHLLPERNDGAAVNRLIGTLHDIGVVVLSDRVSEDVAALCEGALADRHGAAAIFDGTPTIVLCAETTGQEEVDEVVTFKHELMHVVQWCHAGRPDTMAEVGEIGWVLSDFTAEAFLYAMTHYERDEVLAEAEAQTFATSTSILGVAKTLQRYCLGAQ
jgi:hypothetical protein